MLKKILIADPSEEFRLSLCGALCSDFTVLCCGNGQEALELLRTQKPDFLVMDLILPVIDGMGVLKQAKQEEICPPVLVTTGFTRDHIANALQQFNVVYMVLKPCELSAIASRIRELVLEFSPQLFFHPDPHSLVTTALFELGLAPKRAGFRWSRQAILILKDNPGAQLTKEIYPSLAEDGNGNSVEKNIRDAIADAWNRRNDAVWRRYFPPDPSGEIPRPTNKVFLYTLTEVLFRTDSTGYQASG